MFRSGALFLHVVAVPALFAGLAIEGFGVDAARRAAVRISGIALVLMAIAGAVSRRASASDALLGISLWVRAACGLAVGFRMIAKPDAESGRPFREWRSRMPTLEAPRSGAPAFPDRRATEGRSDHRAEGWRLAAGIVRPSATAQPASTAPW